jgi:hypothetical protein
MLYTTGWGVGGGSGCGFVCTAHRSPLYNPITLYTAPYPLFMSFNHIHTTYSPPPHTHTQTHTYIHTHIHIHTHTHTHTYTYTYTHTYTYTYTYTDSAQRRC